MVLQSLVHPARTLDLLNKQRESNLFTDVVILVSTERFSAHRALLAAHSSIFLQVLEGSSLSQEPTIQLDNVEPRYFSIILDFIYTSKLSINVSNVDQVAATSSFLKITSVVDLCTKFKQANQIDGVRKKQASSNEIEVKKDRKRQVNNEDESHINTESSISDDSSYNFNAVMKKPLSGSSKEGGKVSLHVASSICTKVVTQTSLQSHMRSHTSKKHVSCDQCGKSFANIYNLKIHTRTHTGERPYKCPTCPRTFADPSSLCKHKLWHSGVKKKECPVCGRMFRNSAHVREHMRTHTGEKPFQCPHCEKRYGYKCDLTRHMREHTGDFLGPCKHCGRLFSHHGNYMVHLRTHEKQRRDAGKSRPSTSPFCVSRTISSDTVALVPTGSRNSNATVVKVTDLSQLVAGGRELEVVLDNGKLVVKQPLKDMDIENEIVVQPMDDIIRVDCDDINKDDEQLVVVDQII